MGRVVSIVLASSEVELVRSPLRALSVEDQEVVRRYVAEVQAAAPLDAAEEQVVLDAALKADEDARRRLAESYLMMVVEVAGRLTAPTPPSFDLIQEGNMALIRAINEVAQMPSGLRFADFAEARIEAAITEAM
jgi:DNA-directed RNA polymerase sigma subunit (sigma70/sigma32)